MRSNNKAVIVAMLLTGGCSTGWWRDPPAAPSPAPASDAGYASGLSSDPQGGAPYPDNSEPVDPASPVYGANQPGADYATTPVRATRLPKQRAEPVSVDRDYEPPPAQAVRYDNVGYAVWSAQAGTVAGAHPTLPPGTFVEVTSLDTGHTVLVPITATSRPGHEIELSGAAAQELGLGADGGQAGVRVRATNATGADIGALKAGRPAPARPDTPPVLLHALRRKLSGTQGQAGTPTYIPPAQTAPMQARPTPRPTVPAVRDVAARPTPSVARPPAAGTGYYVQVAAIPDQQRALTIAQQLGGAVANVGGTYRVRFGPFDDLATAQAARDDVAGRGYAEARIVRQD